MAFIDRLDVIAEDIRAEWTKRNAARDATLTRSRELIRLCATVIRASHRDDLIEAQHLLDKASTAASIMCSEAAPYPDLYFAGYTRDALKELAEAHITVAFAQGRPIPTPEEIEIEAPAYLNGLAEAASEMRRRSLDRIRHGQNAEAERLLMTMDEVYAVLMTFDFPDAITGGLRRRVDQLRGVLERTRGDLTMSMRQDALRQALRDFELRIENLDAGTVDKNVAQ